jgi:hypothetical protein
MGRWHCSAHGWFALISFPSKQVRPNFFSSSAAHLRVGHAVVVVWVQQTTIVVVTTRFNRKLGQLKRISAMETDSQR